MSDEVTTGSGAATREHELGATIARHRGGIIIGLITIVIAFILWHLLFGQSKKDPPPAPLLVQTMTVAPKMVPEIIETSGRIISAQTVEIRPQADGVLESVRIADGAEVRRGQVLFTIDPRPLRASLSQAQATLARDQALVRDAEDTARRYAALAQSGAVDLKSSVTANNTLTSLRGTVASDAALVRAARLSLGYTVIRAPISGRAGAIQVKPGNLVTAGSSTALVTINTGSGIEVSFALPHVQVDAVRHAGGTGLPVLALDSMSGTLLGRGQLYFLDNEFDDSSGTLTVRGRFANAGGGLYPGQFVTVRVVLSEDPTTLAVPESALQQGQAGPYVYCLVNGKAVLRQLTVARMVDGQAVVTKGIKAGDTVILTVPNELKDGSSVQSSNQHLPGATPTPSAAPKA